jgi:hypothetical protein
MVDQKPRKTRKYKESHTSQSQLGMGDTYQTGIKAKIGRMRSGMGMVELSQKKMGTPPKSLA